MSMKRTTDPFGRRRGFALLVVLGVLTIVIIYLVAAQGSLQLTRLANSRTRAQADRAEAAASIMALAMAQGESGVSPQPQSVQWTDRIALRYEVRMRPADASASAGLAAFPFRPGDALLTIAWDAGTLPAARDLYLINLRGGRPGVVAGTAAAATDDGATTTALSTQSDLKDPS